MDQEINEIFQKYATTHWRIDEGKKLNVGSYFQYSKNGIGLVVHNDLAFQNFKKQDPSINFITYTLNDNLEDDWVIYNYGDNFKFDGNLLAALKDRAALTIKCSTDKNHSLMIIARKPRVHCLSIADLKSFSDAVLKSWDGQPNRLVESVFFASELYIIYKKSKKSNFNIIINADVPNVVNANANTTLSFSGEVTWTKNFKSATGEPTYTGLFTQVAFIKENFFGHKGNVKTAKDYDQLTEPKILSPTYAESTECTINTAYAE